MCGAQKYNRNATLSARTKHKQVTANSNRLYIKSHNLSKNTVAKARPGGSPLQPSRALLPHSLLSPGGNAKPTAKQMPCGHLLALGAVTAAVITLCSHVPPLSLHLLALAFSMMLGVFGSRNGVFM